MLKGLPCRNAQVSGGGTEEVSQGSRARKFITELMCQSSYRHIAQVYLDMGGLIQPRDKRRLAPTHRHRRESFLSYACAAIGLETLWP